MRRFIIAAVMACLAIGVGASAAQATHNCSVDSIIGPATSSKISGTATISWQAGGHCGGTWTFTVQAGPAGSLTTLGTTSTLSSKVGTFTWNTTSFPDGSTYEVKVSVGTSSASTTGITVDNTAPVITFNGQSPQAVDDWNNTDVDLAWSCSDALSGVVNASRSATVTGEGAALSATGTCTDLAGNSATDTRTVKIDRTQPEIVLLSQTPANAAGWNNTDVTVEWSCADALSGVVQPAISLTLGTDGEAQAAGATCFDIAGNSASDGVSDINIDQTSPEITLASRTAANDAGWTAGPVSIGWTCDDALSGAIDTGDSALLTEDGAGQSATGSCADVAGNTATDIQGGVNIDTVAPSIELTSRTPANAAGWNNTDVSLEWSCADATSGAIEESITKTVSTEGAALSESATCADHAGNTSSDEVGGIKLDKTDPALTLVSRTAANANGWNNTNVDVAWDCTDGLSGAVESPIARTVSAEGAGQSVTVDCVDVAGNSTSDTVDDINIDKTAGVVTISQTSALDAVVLPGGEITGTALDLGSGIDSVTVTFTDLLGNDTERAAVLEGTTWSVNTDGLLTGPYTVAAIAADLAGNAATAAPATFVKI